MLQLFGFAGLFGLASDRYCGLHSAISMSGLIIFGSGTLGNLAFRAASFRVNTLGCHYTIRQNMPAWAQLLDFQAVNQSADPIRTVVFCLHGH